VETRRDLLLGVGVLFALNLLLAFTAIGLFGRMGPVIDRIIRENVYSIEAGEEMLTVLARSPDGPLAPAERDPLSAALGRASSNVTEAAEVQILDRIRSLEEKVFAGDFPARRQMVREVQELIAVNQAALRAADEEARRLGLAGAWFSAMLATFTLFLSALTVRRLMNRLIAPVRELVATLDEVRAGNVHRRCVANQAPRELNRVFRDINQILDVHFNPRPLTEHKAKIDRAVALWAIGREPDAIFVIDERGNIHASNDRGHDLLGSTMGPVVRGSLSTVVAREPKIVKLPGGTEIHGAPLSGQTAWLCRVKQPRPTAERAPERDPEGGLGEDQKT
jgi:PAS domain-containing protein